MQEKIFINLGGPKLKKITVSFIFTSLLLALLVTTIKNPINLKTIEDNPQPNAPRLAIEDNPQPNAPRLAIEDNPQPNAQRFNLAIEQNPRPNSYKLAIEDNPQPNSYKKTKI